MVPDGREIRQEINGILNKAVGRDDQSVTIYNMLRSLYRIEDFKKDIDRCLEKIALSLNSISPDDIEFLRMANQRAFETSISGLVRSFDKKVNEYIKQEMSALILKRGLLKEALITRKQIEKIVNESDGLSGLINTLKRFVRTERPFT